MRIVLVLLAFDFTLSRPPRDAHRFHCPSYEMQVSRSTQRGGMGKALMKCLYEIARGWNMQKVVLTVFKGDDTWSFFFFGLFHILRAGVSQRTTRRSYFTRLWGLCDFSR